MNPDYQLFHNLLSCSMTWWPNSRVCIMDYFAAFNDSYDRVFPRCAATKNQSTAFYILFSDLFSDAHFESSASANESDILQQVRLLKQSLLCNMNFTRSKDCLHITELLAKLLYESRQKNDANFYDQWMNSLLCAVQEFDPMYNKDIEFAWRRILTPGVQHMRSICER